MDVQTVSCVVFSPTGTTKKIAESITRALNPDNIEMIDITQASRREGATLQFENQTVVLAVPVYYGRVPEVVVECFTNIQAKQVCAIPVVVYGNRDYEDALRELFDLAMAANMTPLAGGTFVAEHSYSSVQRPIAHGRPDETDLSTSKEFGLAVRNKLKHIISLDDIESLSVPGNFPYLVPENLNMLKKFREVVALTPETDLSMCTECGECVEVCPTEAISSEDVTQTDRWKCLICFACVKTCPESARSMDEPNFQGAIQALYESCKSRKGNEWFI